MKEEKEETSPIEEIHEMLSEYNSSSGKTFYYTEEEAKKLCRAASKSCTSDEVFELWWEEVKKK